MLKFKPGDIIYKNELFSNQFGSCVNTFDEPFLTRYEIEISSEIGRFYILKGDKTRMTHPSHLIEHEFDLFTRELTRFVKIKKILFNIYN
jgi:hypothetical protein